MKFKACATAMLAILAFVFPHCGSKGKGQLESGKLLIYNWTYYMPDDVLRGFEKEFNTRIVCDPYSSNEEMFTKLKAGGTGYDLVFPSEDYVSIMIHEHMLDTIDPSKVPNARCIDSAVIARIDYDKGRRFSVPYMMGSAGIAVNTKYVKEYPRSWKIYDNPQFRNRMTLLDDMREVLGAALKSLGYSVNSVEPKELEQAKKVVLGWKKNIQKFDAEAFAKGFAAGEFYIVHCYAENVFKEYDSTRYGEIDFFIPQEGMPMYIDNMCILKDAKHKDLAHAFINYIHRPAVYARICDYLMLPCMNTEARTLITVTPNYTVDELKKSELKHDLGENLARWDKVWQEIRIGN